MNIGSVDFQQQIDFILYSVPKYLLGARRNRSIFSDNFLALRSIRCGNGFNYSEMLADAEGEGGSSPFKGVDVAVVVDFAFLNDP